MQASTVTSIRPRLRTVATNRIGNTKPYAPTTFAGAAISSTTIARNTAPAIASTMRFCFNMEMEDCRVLEAREAYLVKRHSFPDSSGRFTFHLSRTTRPDFLSILRERSPVVRDLQTIEFLGCQL